MKSFVHVPVIPRYSVPVIPSPLFGDGGDSLAWTIPLPDAAFGDYLFTYDDLNRMKTATRECGGAQVVAANFDYVPNTTGWQVATQTVNGAVRNFTWGYGGELLTESFPGLGSRTYVNAGVDHVLWMLGSNEPHFYLNDVNGSVYAITGGDGHVQERQRYDAFGNTQITAPIGGGARRTSALGNDLGYMGRTAIPELGLHYFRARMYSSEVGGFMSRDPAGLVNGPSVYGFCGGDPVNRTDPMGTEWETVYSGHVWQWVQKPGEPADPTALPDGATLQRKLGSGWHAFTDDDVRMHWLLGDLGKYLAGRAASKADAEAAVDRGEKQRVAREEADARRKAGLEGIAKGGAEAKKGIREMGKEIAIGVIVAVAGEYVLIKVLENGGWVYKTVNKGKSGAKAEGAEAGAASKAGQEHHAVSRKVAEAAEDSPGLKGNYEARDPRFVTKAKDQAAHRGYQKWHRELDQEVEEWIQRNPDKTPEEFEKWLRDRYNKPDLRGRFPDGLPKENGQ